MNLSSKFQTRLLKKHWQRPLPEAALTLAVILGAQYWQTRGLPEGVVPPLVVVLTVGADNTATLVSFLSARGQNIRLQWTQTPPA